MKDEAGAARPHQGDPSNIRHSRLERLIRVFSSARNALIFLLVAAAAAAVLSITSGIFVPSVLELNPLAEPLGIAGMLAISVLFALNATVIFSNYADESRTNAGTAFAGGFAALFTTACPVCQPVWLVWLGFGSATAFMADVSVYIWAASAVLLSVSLYYSLGKHNNTCEVKKNGKKH